MKKYRRLRPNKKNDRPLLMKTTQAATRRWVDPTCPEDVRYWARELGCSEWKLLDAVAFVGMWVDDVRRHLANRAGVARPH